MTHDNSTDFNQLTNANRESERPKLAVVHVDRLADELVNEYNNPNFRRWYCGVIYEFGTSTVIEWRSRARTGRVPARLFSKYVSEARTFRKRDLH